MDYTKGEWEVSKHATPSYAPQYGIYSEGSNDFCIVKDENAESNAHLIASAPDLFEALKEADNWLNGRLVCGGKERLISITQRALAKSKGNIDS